MSWFSSAKKNQSTIPWIHPVDIDEVTELLDQETKPIIFFKHSTRCSISAMALDRLEREWDVDSIHLKVVYIDVLNQRHISDFLARIVGVEHQSPQLLLVNQGKCVYHASHNQISLKPIINFLQVNA
jgi:bacillithiol system protein YtxJ